MWLLAGLGNPDEKYLTTRHNIGFLVADALVESDSNASFSSGFRGQIAKLQMGADTLQALKPLTYMNRSGESVQPAASYFKIAPNQLIVVHDELDLPLGVVRLKKGGGHGGHNGLRDIIRCLGPDFIRVRMGIGRPPIKGMESNYVLNRYQESEWPTVDQQIEQATKAIKMIVEQGLTKAQEQFNRK